MSRAQMNTNKRRGAAQMRSTPSFTYSAFPSSLCPASDPEWQDAHPEFPRIVFHGLRHSSATYQLMISGGDVKAVQGTTGHASANLLVNTYAHIQQDSRKKLGKKFEEGFYKPGATLVQAAPVEAEPAISVSALLELLKDADPSVKARLRLALLT